MAKLINLNIHDAKNMICVWNENNEEYSFESGLMSDDAVRGFMIPRYYIVGVFSDGMTKAAGITSLNDINQLSDDDDLFLFDEFLRYVDFYAAKAFVRLEISNGGYDERCAKCSVYENLLKSGVTISDKARQYLTSEL